MRVRVIVASPVFLLLVAGCSTDSGSPVVVTETVTVSVEASTTPKMSTPTTVATIVSTPTVARPRPAQQRVRYPARTGRRHQPPPLWSLRQSRPPRFSRKSTPVNGMLSGCPASWMSDNVRVQRSESRRGHFDGVSVMQKFIEGESSVIVNDCAVDCGSRPGSPAEYIS